MTAATGHGSALRMRLDLAAPALHRAATRLWRPTGLAERYPRYLETMHAVVRASVPLMEAAERAATRLHRGDPLARPLRRYLREHIVEERHHDDWLLADLRATGTDPAGVLEAAPGPAIARMVGAQYYWISHYHPVSLLGYIAVLEGNAPSPELAAHLAATTGLPVRAFHTLHYHALADVGHAGAVGTLLDRLPLTATQLRAVHLSALSTVDDLATILTRLGGTE